MDPAFSVLSGGAKQTVQTDYWISIEPVLLLLLLVGEAF